MILQYAILGFLLRSSLTGYQLGKIFSKSLNLVWVASLSQIYRELRALEKHGLVISRQEKQIDRPDKVVYTITEAGETAFRDWLKNYPEELFTEKRDEFMLRVFFGSSMGKDELINHYKHFIEERLEMKKALEAAREETDLLVKKSKSDKDQMTNLDNLSTEFLYRRASMSIETTLHWAEQCLVELEQL